METKYFDFDCKDKKIDLREAIFNLLRTEISTMQILQNCYYNNKLDI